MTDPSSRSGLPVGSAPTSLHLLRPNSTAVRACSGPLPAAQSKDEQEHDSQPFASVLSEAEAAHGSALIAAREAAGELAAQAEAAADEPLLLRQAVEAVSLAAEEAALADGVHSNQAAADVASTLAIEAAEAAAAAAASAACTARKAKRLVKELEKGQLDLAMRREKVLQLPAQLRWSSEMTQHVRGVCGDLAAAAASGDLEGILCADKELFVCLDILVALPVLVRGCFSAEGASELMKQLGTLNAPASRRMHHTRTSLNIHLRFTALVAPPAAALHGQHHAAAAWTAQPP